MESAASTWTFTYAYGYRTGNIVLLNFSAVAQVNTTTLQFKDFVALFGDFYVTNNLVYNYTEGNTQYGTVEKSGNNLNLALSKNQEKGTTIMGNLIIVLK